MAGCCVAGNDTAGVVVDTGAVAWVVVAVAALVAGVVAREGEVTDEEEGSLGRHVGLARLCAREPEGDDCWNSGCLPGAPVDGCVEEGGVDVGAPAALAAVVCCDDVGGWGVTCWGGGVGCGLPCTILA